MKTNAAALRDMRMRPACEPLCSPPVARPVAHSYSYNPWQHRGPPSPLGPARGLASPLGARREPRLGHPQPKIRENGQAGDALMGRSCTTKCAGAIGSRHWAGIELWKHRCYRYQMASYIIGIKWEYNNNFKIQVGELPAAACIVSQHRSHGGQQRPVWHQALVLQLLSSHGAAAFRGQPCLNGMPLISEPWTAGLGGCTSSGATGPQGQKFTQERGSSPSAATTGSSNTTCSHNAQ